MQDSTAYLSNIVDTGTPRQLTISGDYYESASRHKALQLLGIRPIPLSQSTRSRRSFWKKACSRLKTKTKNMEKRGQN